MDNVPQTPHYRAVRVIDLFPAIQHKEDTLCYVHGTYKGEEINLMDPDTANIDLSVLFLIAIAPYYDVTAAQFGLEIVFSDEIQLEEYPYIPE